MSKKYVIDLPDDAQYILINGASENHCYTRVERVEDLEGLNSDYINEHYGQMQDEAYQAGLEDGWETARALVWDTSISEYETAGVKVESWDGETCEVLRRYPAHEAVELLRTINHIGQPKLDFQSDIDRFVRNANEAITELAKKFVENMKDMYK
jgi:hypothetical protein